MSLVLKAVYNALIGGWGGFIAWALLDLVWRTSGAAPLSDALLNGATVGLCVGAAVTSFEGLAEQRFRVFARGLVIGAISGVVGGAIGLFLGEALYQSLQRAVAWRIIGWVLFGLGIGLAEGIASKSRKRALQGALGGAVGGFLGSIAFLFIRQAVHSSVTSRAVGFVLLGMAIGFFIGLVQALLKSAWLKVISSGPLEGKEFSLTKPETVIGRDDRYDVGLFGDPKVLPRHAEIRHKNGSFVLTSAAGSQVSVNDRAVSSEQILSNNDVVRIASFTLLFREKKKG